MTAVLAGPHLATLARDANPRGGFSRTSEWRAIATVKSQPEWLGGARATESARCSLHLRLPEDARSDMVSAAIAVAGTGRQRQSSDESHSFVALASTD